jgi:hypothetical protein
MSKIVGYIHVCQMPGWKQSFDLLIKSLTENGLYEASEEIRVGIVTETGKVEPDDRLHNPKFNIIYVGTSCEYERATLHHMRQRAKHETCKYWYLHTKGLRHFGTPREKSVINWINIMLYWNVTKWRDAVKILDSYDTYGCMRNEVEIDLFHYSGNFWWGNSNYIATLPEKINLKYRAPEDWIGLNLNVKGFSAWNHRYNDNYFINIPKKDYELEVTKSFCNTRGNNNTLIRVNPGIVLPTPPNYNLEDEDKNNIPFVPVKKRNIFKKIT